MCDLEDDDVPQLSFHALAALQEFYAEQKQHSGDDKYSIGRIEENWVSKCFPYLLGNIGVEPSLNLDQCLSTSHLLPKYVPCHLGADNILGELVQKASRNSLRWCKCTFSWC